MSTSGRDLENDSSNNVSAPKNEIHPTGRGVLTVAADHPKYAEQAVALARSIRLRDRNIPLAVLTNLPEENFLGLYDYVISWDFQGYPGLLSKLVVYDGSPFEETLFLDADILAVRSVNEVFDCFAGHSFAVWGINLVEPIWFRGIVDHVRSIVPAETYPNFNGGLVYFRRSDTAHQVYKQAKNFIASYDELRLRRRRDVPMNEEPLLSLAMAQTGLHAVRRADLCLMASPWLPRCEETKLDVLAGFSKVPRPEGFVQPALVHFVGQRKRAFAYSRELRRLAAAYPSGRLSYLHDAFLRATSYIHWRLTRRSSKSVHRQRR
jgi:hypothetical protein